MDIGIRLHDTIGGTLKERLRYVKDQGFSCVHLALSKTIEGFRMEDAPRRLADPAFAEEIREAFESTGLRIAVLGCYLAMTNPDPEQLLRTREIYFAHLKFARMIGAEMVGTETPAPANAPFASAPSNSEEGFRLFMDALKPIVRRAEEEGVVLAVEPVWSHIISTPERAQRVLEEIPSDHLKIILDAVNLISPENAGKKVEIVEDAITRLGDRVSLLHMKDFRLQDGKMKSIACGTGEMQYEQLLRFAGERKLAMTLEDTRPENAEAARLFLEEIARKC